MSRPMKWRTVCCLPACTRFGPLDTARGSDGIVRMTVDEYETIRLIDLEGYTQEECAGQMNVARTTVQGIYNEARKKLADSLVNSKTLIIEGGEFRLCEGREGYCRCGYRKHRCRHEFGSGRDSDIEFNSNKNGEKQ